MVVAQRLPALQLRRRRAPLRRSPSTPARSSSAPRSAGSPRSCWPGRWPPASPPASCSSTSSRTWSRPGPIASRRSWPTGPARASPPSTRSPTPSPPTTRTGPDPTDLSGLRKNVRERDGRFYWHWDPAFVGGTADLPPSEISDTERLERAVGGPGRHRAGAAGAGPHERPGERGEGGGVPRPLPAGRVRRRVGRGPHGGRRPQRRLHRRGARLPRPPPRRVDEPRRASAVVDTPSPGGHG